MLQVGYDDFQENHFHGEAMRGMCMLQICAAYLSTLNACKHYLRLNVVVIGIYDMCGELIHVLFEDRNLTC